MNANPVLQTSFPYALHGEISLGDRKRDRVDLSAGDSSGDGDRHGTPTRTDFQDPVTRLDLCLGDDVTDFPHLSSIQVIEDVFRRRGSGGRRNGNSRVVELEDGIVSFPRS